MLQDKKCHDGGGGDDDDDDDCDVFLSFSGRNGYSSEPTEPGNPTELTTGSFFGCRPAGDGWPWHTTHKHTSES